MVNSAPMPPIDNPIGDEEFRAIVERAVVAAGLVSGRPVDDVNRTSRLGWSYSSIIPRQNTRSFTPKQGANTLETIRLVIDRDPDASKAVMNFLLLMGKGYKTKAEIERANGTVAEDKAGTSYLHALDRRVGGEYGGGMNAVVNVNNLSLIWQGAIAMWAEMSADLSEIIDVHPVDPSLITFQREKDTGRLMRGVFDEHGNFAELNQRQFLYVPFHPMVGNPYGRSPLLAALTALFFKIELLEDLRAVVHNQGHPRLDVTVALEMISKAVPAHLRQVGREAELGQFVQGEIEKVAQAYRRMKPDDSMVHGDNIAIDYKGPNGSLDFKSLSEILDNQIVAGLKQLPVLLGRNEGATTTHATVQWEIFALQIEALQYIHKRALEWFHTLALAVKGFTSVAHDSFVSPETKDRKAEAEARQVEIANEIALADRGWQTEDEGANNIVGHGAVAPPKPAVAPVAAAAAVTTKGVGHGEVRIDHPSVRVTVGGGIRASHRAGVVRDDHRQAGNPQRHAGGEQHVGQQPVAGEPVRAERAEVPEHERLTVAIDGIPVEDEDDGTDTSYPFHRPNPQRAAWYDYWVGIDYLPRGRDTSIKSWTIKKRADGAVDHEANLDDLIDETLPDVKARWSKLSDDFPSRDVADGKTTPDKWFGTDAGLEWLGSFRTLLTDHYARTFDVRGQIALGELGIEGVFRLENPDVLAALDEFGLERVAGMAEETVAQVLTALEQGLANGDHPREIARSIRAKIDGMSATRAYTIARTETAHAYSYAAQECFSRNGVKKKEWLSAGDSHVDPPCPSYVDEGAIGIDERFGGEHMYPPAHPNCRCALIPNLDGFEELDEPWIGA